ncbi:ABC transporter substrate-binding protein/permease [Fructilactobacillus myrtifloralis]|uniref:ABC transporter substrate-binding protein/permease n=2 Tax=Fructilactobacillus myrtifloralis TaxID=2940301 RepID=A0ABY5BNT9_9LACO|nr:ABC transporter substrate-binding protein/permease [Fructilactobacillus myrtifloralis]USS85350.1 ABC transporter substrate-binding protein/permease [Fructilactobacillus myrtifloralis]
MQKQWLKWFVVGMLVFVGASICSRSVHADDSLQRVKEKGVLTVATSPDYPPFEFQVNQHGHAKDVGMDIELAKQIARDLGVRLQVKNMDFNALLVAIQTGKADLAIGGINPTPARQQNADFSQIYYYGGESFLVNRADAGKLNRQSALKGLKVGTQTGTMQERLAKQKLKGTHVVTMDKATDLILALKTHKVDAVGVETPVAKAYVENDPELKDFKAAYQLNPKDTGSAVALPKGATTLQTAVNHSIQTAKTDHLFPKYLKTAGKYMQVNTANTSMWHYWKYFLAGLKETLLISVCAVLGGIGLGVILALMRLSSLKWLSWPALSYVEVVRGTPMMVQVLLVYFGLGVFINIPALPAGIIAVTLNSAAYVSEIIRGGINSVAKGQGEATRSLGLTKADALRFVILPQAFKNIWPALGNEFISVIKESSIVSIIGVTDLVYELNVVRADTYRGVAPIVVVMVIYFVLTFTLTRLLNYWEKKMKHT